MFSIKYISYKNAHDRTIFIFCYVIIFWKIGCANFAASPLYMFAIKSVQNRSFFLLFHKCKVSIAIKETVPRHKKLMFDFFNKTIVNKTHVHSNHDPIFVLSRAFVSPNNLIICFTKMSSIIEQCENVWKNVISPPRALRFIPNKHHAVI